MNLIKSDWIVLVAGVYFLLAGIKTIKIDAKSQAAILSIMMAICAIAVCLIDAFVFLLEIRGWWRTILSQIDLLIGGVWLGIFVVMLAFRQFKLLKRPFGKNK